MSVPAGVAGREDETPDAGPWRPAGHWTPGGPPGTVTVVGLGKIGLPLAAQYAQAGWHVIGVDVAPAVVEGLNAGRSHVAEEPGLSELVARSHAEGRLEATLDHADAARRADVVVVIVPLGLSDEHQPDYRALDAATAAVGRGLRAGTLVVYETTLPVGDTRGRFGPALERVSGLRLGDPERGFLLAFSPERVSSGRVFRDLASYPKLVGGVDTASTERAAAFYRSVLDAEVRTLSSSEVAEFTKLAETTYRDVNIALANELARASERAGVDILEVIEAANSQPYSHLHAPGLGVGGHCIPVYPHFLLDRAPDLELVRTARRINQDQVGWAVRRLQTRLGDLKGAKVLLLGLTYRDGVHELAHSRALPLIERLRVHGAQLHAFDPLLSEDEIQGCGAVPYRWGDELPARTIVTQTADPLWRTLDFGQFPELELVFDGRNSLRGIQLPAGVAYLGVGAPPIRATYSPGE